MAVFDITNFGAVGDDVVDDTESIQAAIDAAVANGSGSVYFPAPPVAYRVQPQQSGTDALTIGTTRQIKLYGDSSSVSRIKFYVFGGLDPTTNWEVIDGLLHRGCMFNVVGASVFENQPTVVFQDLDLDGNIQNANENDTSFPADPITGSGWDVTNKGIKYSDFYRTIELDSVRVHNFRGELVYLGNGQAESLVVEGSVFHSTDANGLNVSLANANRVMGCEFYDLGNDAFEQLLGGGGTYQNNRIYDCKRGMSIGQHKAQEEWLRQPIFVLDNFIDNCTQSGIVYYGTLGVIDNNFVRDCATAQGGSSWGGIVLHQGLQANYPDNREDIKVTNNLVLADQRRIDRGIYISDSAAKPIRRYSVANNIIRANPNGAVTFGFYVKTPGDGSGGLLNGNILEKVERLINEDFSLDEASPQLIGNVFNGV